MHLTTQSAAAAQYAKCTSADKLDPLTNEFAE